MNNLEDEDKVDEDDPDIISERGLSSEDESFSEGEKEIDPLKAEKKTDPKLSSKEKQSTKL